MPFTSAYLKILGSIDLYQPHKNVNYVLIVKVHAFPFTAFLYVNGSMAIYTGILPRGTIWYTHFSFQQFGAINIFPVLHVPMITNVHKSWKKILQSELNLFDKYFHKMYMFFFLSVTTQIQITKFLILKDSIYCSLLLNLNVYIILKCKL